MLAPSQCTTDEITDPRVATVDPHANRVLSVLDARDRVHLVVLAQRLDLAPDFDPEDRCAARVVSGSTASAASATSTVTAFEGQGDP